MVVVSPDRNGLPNGKAGEFRVVTPLLIWNDSSEEKYIDALRSMGFERVIVLDHAETNVFPSYDDLFFVYSFPSLKISKKPLYEYFSGFNDMFQEVCQRETVDILVPFLGLESYIPVSGEFMLPLLRMTEAQLDKSSYLIEMQKAGFPVTKTFMLILEDEIPSIKCVNRFPIVAKPAFGAGSSGTHLIKNEDDFNEYFSLEERGDIPPHLDWGQTHKRHYNYFSGGKPYLLQDYVPGEVISCGVNILPDNSVEVEVVFDTLYNDHPNFFGEVGYVWPSKYPGIENKVKELFEEGIRLGFFTCNAWMADIKVTPVGDLVLIEATPRPTADGLNLLFYGFSSNYYLKRSLALGMGIDFRGFQRPLEKQWPICYRMFCNPPGVIEHVTVPDVRRDPNVLEFVCELRPGSRIFQPRMTAHQKRQGYIVTTGTNREDALNLAENYISQVEVEYR